MNKAASSETCQICDGKCCRSGMGYRVVHMGSNYYTHVCEYCEDGVKCVPPRTAKEERADVVAHLRERAIHGAGIVMSVEDMCTILADLFERGEHCREEE